MIRNLKILLAAAAALTAFGAFGASGAQAAEFHCSVEPCRYTLNPDGTGKTAHHVFIIETKDTSSSISFTCPGLSGEGTSNTKTASNLRVTNLNYTGECKVQGSTGVEVIENGCNYEFTAGGEVAVACPESEQIEIVSALGCIYTIGSQTGLSSVSYHTIGTTPNREVTVSTDVHGIAVELDGTQAQCLIDPTADLEGTYTTGNTVVTAETHEGEMADGWWE